MFRIGVFLLNAGRIRNSVAAPTSFNAGAPTLGLGVLARGAANNTKVGGLSYSTAGALFVDNAGAIVSYAPGGIPITAAGAVAVEDTGAGVISFYNGGLPYTAARRLVLALPE